MNLNFKLLTVLYIAILVTFSACQNDDEFYSPIQSETEEYSISKAVVNGIVRIKFTKDSIHHINNTLKSSSLKTGIGSIDTLLNAIGALSVERTFPYSGRFEKRSKQRGLHLWYDIKYDTTKAKLTSVINKFESLTTIESTEAIASIKTNRIKYKSVNEFTPFSNTLKSASISNTKSLNFFNDPYLNNQWNYFNDGSVTDAIKGADINILNAWQKETGSADVIVAIIDGGIDTDHEDLADNIWVNSNEYSGSDNQDDDDNGYKDDKYGYNFVSSSGHLTDHEHGTHIAGTIGAINNNGIGVCGIAGGDDTHSGAKLMSCQVFEMEGSEEKSALNFAEAIKYAADNGAVICQNSWGYDETDKLPQSMKEAIDYFVDFAGIDANGNQTGPMRGGVVIFASGNDNKNASQPSSYENVIAVSAMAPDYTMAYYSNYGSWVDFLAPGGSDEFGSKYDTDCMILSTIPNNIYAYTTGTSMACPHVSGVAALIVSHFGKEGFTPEMLKTRLKRGAINLDAYNTDYSNMLGVGLINASAALADDNGIAPEKVTDLEASAASNRITAYWSVTSDLDDIKPHIYTVYYSKSPFSKNEMDGEVNVRSILVGTASVGDQLSFQIEELEFNTKYYISISGTDILGTESDFSDQITVTTKSNQTPVIIPDNNNTNIIKAHETVSLLFSFEDPDKHELSWQLIDESGKLTSSEEDSTIEIVIVGSEVSPGKHTADLKVSDIYNASTTYTINYTILENHAPVVIQPIDDIYLGKENQSIEIDLTKYIADSDNEELNYLISSSTLIQTYISDNLLIMTPLDYGLSTTTIRAEDGIGEACELEFKIMSRNDENAVDIYPNPVTDFVNIRMGNGIESLLSITVLSSSGAIVKTLSAEISTFSPAKINLSSLESGSYTLVIEYNSTKLERSIIKL